MPSALRMALLTCVCVVAQRGGPRTSTVRVQVAIDFMDAIKGGKREIRLGGFKGMPAGKTVEVDIPPGEPHPPPSPPRISHPWLFTLAPRLVLA